MIKHFYLLVLLLFSLSCSTQKTQELNKSRSLSRYQNTNPAQDEFWNDMAFDATENSESIIKVLEERNPKLLKQMLEDSSDPLLLSFWGESINFDSAAKKIIVEEKILRDLESLFHLQSTDIKAHAGVIHTYGYLFSTIETPYGHKRARWIAPTLTNGFKLKDKSLSPNTTDGTLLSNVTFFAGKLAFSSTEKLQQLNALKNISNEIFTYNFAKLKRTKLYERTKNFTLITTFVKFPAPSGDANDYLLIYSYKSITGEEKLVTAFPVSNESYLKTVDPKNLGENKTITLRYNAHIEFWDQSVKGSRSVSERPL